MATLLELQNAGLPATETDGGKNASFSRTLTPSENLLFLSMVDTAEYNRTKAQGDFANIPNWGTWTPAQWSAYYNANISSTQINAIGSLAAAIPILNKMSTVIDSLAKAEIATRNKVFPDL